MSYNVTAAISELYTRIVDLKSELDCLEDEFSDEAMDIRNEINDLRQIITKLDIWQ
jgi:hypothetical protein